PRKHNKAHLFTEKIRWRTPQSGSNQPLLHSRKACFHWACGKKFYLLVRIQTKMLEYVPCYDLKIASQDIEPYCLSPKVLDRLKLRPSDECGGKAGHITGRDFGRNSTARCGGPDAKSPYNNRLLR